jgi:signal transduction histidine kinase
MGAQSQPCINIGMRQEGEEPVYYVQDNGIGIAPRYHEKVFGLFERLDIASDGTGIGLTLVKRIIEVHGGRVWVESAGEGQGSTFCFTLPGQDTGGTRQA